MTKDAQSTRTQSGNLPKSPSRMWINLSAFSGKGRDLGVQKFLINAGFKPSAISLLVCCPDFVHEHDGVIDDTPLRWEYSAYGGWRRTRRWTRKEFKKAVSQLHEHGIKVYLSCMANAHHYYHEMMSEWAKNHPELFVVHSTGLRGFTDQGKWSSMRYYNIAEKFRDGTLYEDFFAAQVTKTVVDYGFDGFHAADGYKSFVWGIMGAGFSKGMLDQFGEDTGIKLPDYHNGKETTVIPPVAEWIWKNKRIEWIDFWRRRLNRSWHKVAKTLKAAKKDFGINSCWSTDPLESITRYGMDTAGLETAPTESILFETMDIYTLMGPISGPNSTRREGYVLEGHEFYPSSLMASLLRGVHTPRIKHFPLIHVHDQFERFEFLKSGRSYLERAITGYLQLYRIRGGRLERINNGIWPAVADDLTADEWRFIRDTEKRALAIRPAKIPGPVVLWSSSTIENEIGPSKKRWSLHRSLYELVGAGCPVITAAKIEEIEHLEEAAVMWVNPASFTEQERKNVWQSIKRNRMIIFNASGKITLPPKIANLQIVDNHSGARLIITGRKSDLNRDKQWVIDEAKLLKQRGLLSSVNVRADRISVTPAKKAQPFEYRADMEAHFITRVPPTRLALPYLQLAAGLARRVGWPLLKEVRMHEGPRKDELAGHENNVFYITDKNDNIFLFAENFHRYTSYLQVCWKKTVKTSRQLNSVMFHPGPNGKYAELTIPAWGITMYEVELEK